MDIKATITLDTDQALAIVAHHLKLDYSDVELNFDTGEAKITISTTADDVRKLTRKIEKAVAGAQLDARTGDSTDDDSESRPSQEAT